MKRIMVLSVVLFYSLITAVLFINGCGYPPTQEISDAEVALSNAKNAGAEVYALKEYKGAESKFKEALEAKDIYHYQNARALALEAKDSAELSLNIIENEKTRLKISATESLKSAHSAMALASAADAESYSKESYDEIVNLINDAESALNEGKYQISIKKAKEAKLKARLLEFVSKRALDLDSETGVKVDDRVDKKDEGSYLIPLKQHDKISQNDALPVFIRECQCQSTKV